MTSKERTAIGIGILIGFLLAAVGALWWQQGPSEATVQRTVVTTIQDESPASFLVTGTLDMHVTVQVDSSQYLTPAWLTFVVQQTQPSLLALLQGTSQTQVRVPGTVSYGFDVRDLTPSMVTIEEGERVAVDLPELSVHSVEPDLAKLRVKTQSGGWMRVLSSEAHDDVRQQALSAVRGAFQEQAERRLAGATQPRVHTARALEAMLTPPLKAAGMRSPQFRIHIGEDLVLSPEG